MLENAILFIGLGKNKYKLGEIVETNSLGFVEKNYGRDSCFYKALAIVKTFAAAKTFILNLDAWEDIKAHKNILSDYEFDYIAPLDLYLDDHYYDSDHNRVITYTQLLLMSIHGTISTVVMTGRYAADFENLTEFLENEVKAVNDVRPLLKNLSRENLVYVANNLENHAYANVAAAGVLAVTDYKDYPVSSNFGKAIFDIDYSDIRIPMAYFKNNHLTGTTIENLVNFHDDATIKLVTVNKILHYFHYHKPDTEKFIGTAYSEYKKVKIAEILDEYLKSLAGYIITDYEIISVTDVTTEIGTVDILLRYDIWPKFTAERYKLETSL